MNNPNKTINTFVSLVKQTIETYIKTGRIWGIPQNFPKSMLEKKAGVFVSIHNKDGSLRGCIGTFLPTKDNLAQEIIANAIAAAASDPRFSLISKEELPNLVYTVDILSPSTSLRTSELSSLNPKKYGLIVSTQDGRRGLLLPDIEGVDLPEEQFRICCLKAGIDPQEKVNLQTFTVERHKED